MFDREILIYGNELLREKAQPVEDIDSNVLSVLETMKRLMREASGIGLAGNQVGVLQRIITLVNPDSGGEISLINPVVVNQGSSKEKSEEGCLSIPEVFAKVERPSEILVRGLTPEGQERELEARGLFARILLHEIDHLDGVLFVDRLTPARRLLLAGKLKRFSQERR